MPTTRDHDIARQAWRAAVCAAAADARTAYPTQFDTVDQAEKLVLGGDLTCQQDHSFLVQSQQDPQKQWTVRQKACTCPQGQFLKDGYCKHVLAVLIYRKAYRQTVARVTEATGGPPETEATASHARAHTLEAYIVDIKGHKTVRYVGLLLEAHRQGLISLEATLLSVTPELATATATAIFANGKRFTECADASPDNVNKMVKAHYVRVALTRAKARALRDALGCELVSLEELGEET